MEPEGRDRDAPANIPFLQLFAIDCVPITLGWAAGNDDRAAAFDKVVVEDHPGVSNVATDYLEQYGCKVVQANSAEVAIDALGLANRTA